jgi:hypothetical protein
MNSIIQVSPVIASSIKITYALLTFTIISFAKKPLLLYDCCLIYNYKQLNKIIMWFSKLVLS